MFWGLIMEPERRYTQKVKKSFHISMAALDMGSSDNEASQVMCGHEGRNYLLCTLKKPDMLQCPLDLEFAAGTEVSFASNGKAHIHLTGYLTEVEEDGLSLEDLAEQEDEEDAEEEEQVEETRGKKKKHKKQLEKEPPSKKPKLLNGSIKDEDGEEEESDDLDFEAGEEEAVSEEEGEEESEDGDEDDGDDDDNDNEQEENEEEEEVIDQRVQQKLSKKEKKKLKLEADAEKKLKKIEKPQKKQRQVLQGGVIIEDLVEGVGAPAKPGRFVNVYYEGRFEKNNKLFDSTNKGSGFKFRLGVGEVIKAWDTGLVGMKVGGVRKITCPPHTAYGVKGCPPAIPPNSTLIFKVTLKKVN